MSIFTKVISAVKQTLGGGKEKAIAGSSVFSGINGIRGVSQTLFIDKPLFYEMYTRNPDARSCIRKIAMYMGKEYFFLQKGETKVTIKDNVDEFDKVWTLMSNPTFTLSIIETLKHLIVSGELYLLPTTDLTGKEVNGFQVLHPMSVTKVIKGNDIVGFLQFDGQQSKYYHSELIDGADKTTILKYYQLEKHTENEHNGMGLLEGLAYDVMSDIEAQKRNYATFYNDWTPPSIVMIDENMGETAQALLIQQLQERHKGSANAHKPMIGIGVKEWKSITMTPKDMEHSLQRKMTIEKVCSALDVPKSIIGYVEDVNRATASSELKTFVEGTVNNYQTLFEYIINDFIQTFWDNFEYELIFNRLSIDELEVKKHDLLEVEKGALTLDEYREKYNRESYKMDEAKKPLVSKNVIFLEDVALDAVIDTSNQ